MLPPLKSLQAFEAAARIERARIIQKILAPKDEDEEDEEDGEDDEDDEPEATVDDGQAGGGARLRGAGVGTHQRGECGLTWQETER